MAIDRDNDGMYDPNRDCLWVLMAGEDERVMVRVFIMDVEKTEDCNTDYLEVRTAE